MSSRPRSIVALATFATVAAVALSGCSSSGGGKDAGGGGGSPSAPAKSSAVSSKNAAVAALVPAAIAKKGTVTFALDASYPPDESKDSSGKIVGFDVDLANAMVPLMGLKASLQNVKFANIIPGLQDGKYDVGLSSFTDTKEREKVVDFVTYFKAGEGFYVKAGSSTKFNGLASLCGHKVSVETGTTEQTDAQAQAKKCKVTVLPFDDQSQANLAVSSGRADVGFADSQVAGYIVKQSNGQFETSGTAFGVAPYGIAVQKGSSMAKAIQAALKALVANGTYKTLLTKWGVEAGSVTDPVINGAIS